MVKDNASCNMEHTGSNTVAFRYTLGHHICSVLQICATEDSSGRCESSVLVMYLSS